MLIRLDGAGFSHELLEHIAAAGNVAGRSWEFSAGWSCTDREMDAIAQLPDQAWTAAIEQNGRPVENAYVADLTGLLDLDGWQQKIPGLRVLVRDEPLHPRYRKRATDREKALGRRYQLMVTNTKIGQIAWLDARHRSHVHVENDVNQAKDLGLIRWPSRFWTINVAWTPDRRAGREPVGLLPPPRPPRRRAAGRRPETAALTAALTAVADPRPAHPRATQTLAAPPRRVALDHRRDQPGRRSRRSPHRHDHHPAHLDDHEKAPSGAWNPAHRHDSWATPYPPTRQP
ncbi:MAG: hypothetical protein JOY78_01850 [Pseudonocardia sp.]|nr:hypothetical protein [Pseudonocardia sp.]